MSQFQVHGRWLRPQLTDIALYHLMLNPDITASSTHMIS
jgi:hypothetical protein